MTHIYSVHRKGFNARKGQFYNGQAAAETEAARRETAHDEALSANYAAYVKECSDEINKAQLLQTHGYPTIHPQPPIDYSEWARNAAQSWEITAIELLT